MRVNAKAAFAALGALLFGAVVCLHNPIQAQTPAAPTGDELMRYGPLAVHARDVILISREETKKITTVYVSAGVGQLPLKVEFSGDDSLLAWKELQNPPSYISAKPAPAKP
jgi:hypothetical protein